MLLQLASQQVVAGDSVDKAAKAYQSALVKLVGAKNVETSSRTRLSTHTASGTSLSRAGATGFVAPAVGLIGVFLIFPALWTIYLGLTTTGSPGCGGAPAVRRHAELQPDALPTGSSSTR